MRSAYRSLPDVGCLPSPSLAAIPSAVYGISSPVREAQGGEGRGGEGRAGGKYVQRRSEWGDKEATKRADAILLDFNLHHR